MNSTNKTENAVNSQVDPLNFGGLPIEAEPSKFSDLLFGEQLFIHAYRCHDKEEMAYQATLIMRDRGVALADILKQALETGDADAIHYYTIAVSKVMQLTETVWTYERRLGLYVLGTLAIDYPGLNDAAFFEDAFAEMIDTVGDALIHGMHVLGTPDHLSLAQILDYASSSAPRFEHAEVDGDDE